MPYELSLAEVPVIVGGSMAPCGPDTAALGLVGRARGNNLDLTAYNKFKTKLVVLLLGSVETSGSPGPEEIKADSPTLSHSVSG